MQNVSPYVVVGALQNKSVNTILVNVLGDKSMGIRPKTANTLKIIEKCAKRYSTYKNVNYKKCLKIAQKSLKMCPKSDLEVTNGH